MWHITRNAVEPGGRRRSWALLARSVTAASKLLLLARPRTKKRFLTKGTASAERSRADVEKDSALSSDSRTSTPGSSLRSPSTTRFAVPAANSPTWSTAVNLPAHRERAVWLLPRALGFGCIPSSDTNQLPMSLGCGRAAALTSCPLWVVGEPQSMAD